MPCLPLVGKQFGESILGVIAEALEKIAQVGERIDVEPLAGSDKAGQHGGGPSPIIAAQERPISPTYRDSP